MSYEAALIDADILVYRIGFAVETDFGFDLETPYADFNEAKKLLQNELEVLKQNLGVSKFVFCFSDVKSFRYDILATYKHNRRKHERTKPVLYEDLKNFICQNFDVKIKPKLEADDCLGIISTRWPGRFVIVSRDKDLRQIPGYHYEKDQVFTVSLQEADRWFFIQTLAGDPTDGFSGCPTIGPKKAAKIIDAALAENNQPWATIVETYAKFMLDEQYALKQARLARILRSEDWDFETQEIKLWTP